MIRSLRARRVRRDIEDESRWYRVERSPREVAQCQLEKLNQAWRDASEHVPYYRGEVAAGRLPERYRSWDEYRERVPPTERRHLQRELGDRTSKRPLPVQWRMTGGSTAEPLRLPVWSAEIAPQVRSLWYARSWFDIDPADRLFLVWGHSHTLGSAWTGWRLRGQRVVKDILLGYRRHSAYDLSEDGLRVAGYRILTFRPDYILGYSVALDALARANRERRERFRSLDLKAVVATAEAFPGRDSRGILEDLFACPVVMEYGAVETGPVAHQNRAGDWEVFWRYYHLEAVPSEVVPGAQEVLVTVLFPRAVPLFRYRLGDLIVPDGDGGDIARSFRSVIGRCNDSVVLPGRGVVHSEAFAHALRDLRTVHRFQVVQAPSGAIRLSCVAPDGLVADDLRRLRDRLRRVDPRLEDTRIEVVHRLEQTIAGKTRSVLSGTG